MVKNSQATGSERAVVENTRANQRAPNSSKGSCSMITTLVLEEAQISVLRYMTSTPQRRAFPLHQCWRNFKSCSVEWQNSCGNTGKATKTDVSSNEVRKWFRFAVAIYVSHSILCWYSSEETTHLSASFYAEKQLPCAQTIYFLFSCLWV